MKANIKTLKDYAEEIQDLVLLQKIEDFEAELREYLADYQHHLDIGAEVQRWRYAIFLVKQILGDEEK